MKKIIIIAAALVLASCVGRFRSPKVDTPDKYACQKGFNTDTVNINAEWWRNFGDTTLNRLIAVALLHNQDAAEAYLKVQQAKYEIGNARSEYAPGFEIEASGGAEYEHATKIVQKYTVEPSVSWEISLFGAGRYATGQAKAEYEASLWNYRGVRLSLAAQVATVYFTLLQYAEMLEITRASYALRLRLTAITDSLYKYGMSSALDYRQAVSLTATAAADIPMYERALSDTAMTLDVLLGQNPKHADSTLWQRRLSDNVLPIDIPVGLPSALLERRPDMMQAYAECQQAHSAMGSARAAQFPSISLTGAGGIAASTLKGLTSANPFVWSAELSIAEPLLYMGRLRRNFKIAKLSTEQATLAYRATYIEALEDVESSLDAITTYGVQIREYADFVRANRTILTLTRRLYLDGMTDYLELIDAERTLYSSQQEYIQLVAQQYSNYVALYKALGGGW